ncbi:MAG: alpha/beta hydrolase [Caulobacteraceae bacterium]
MIRRATGALLGAVLAYALAAPASAQPPADPAPGAAAPGQRPAGRPPGQRPPAPGGDLKVAPAPSVPGIRVDHIKVHATSMEGNLEGEPVDRDVVVVLPPSYGKDKGRKYPVLYFLHGFALTGQGFFDFMHLPETEDAAAKAGMEFIIVVPDSDTKLGGTMYSNSVTTGDAEAYIANDLVKYVDGHYRTIAKREARGLVGHSMGGYGTWKIAMRFPEKWNAVYAMSACCMSPRTTTAEAAKKLSELPYDKAPTAGFGDRASLASIAAWSPDPSKPPYYMDFGVKADGTVDPLIVAKWANNSPLVMATSHIPQLKTFKAVASDGGDEDGLTKDAKIMHAQLDLYGVKNSFEEYPGNHTNRIVERFRTKVLPFFAANLQTKQTK